MHGLVYYAMLAGEEDSSHLLSNLGYRLATRRLDGENCLPNSRENMFTGGLGGSGEGARDKLADWDSQPTALGVAWLDGQGGKCDLCTSIGTVMSVDIHTCMLRERERWGVERE